MRRLVRVGVVSLVLLAAAACASTVQGVGDRGTGVAPVPFALHRLVHESSFGDPLRLEMCTGVDAPGFGSFGAKAFFDIWSRFGGCMVDVYGTKSMLFDVYAQAIGPSEVQFVAPDERTVIGGTVRADEFDLTDGTCRWLLYADQFDVAVNSSVAVASQAGPACKATTRLAKQVGTQLASGHEPTRRMPDNSVSGYDMCTLARNSHVDRLPDIGAAAGSNVQSFHLGAECFITTDTYDVTIEPVIDADPVLLGTQVSSGAHPFLTVDVLPDRCRMASEQQGTGVAGAAELLVFEVRPAAGTTATTDLCRSAVRVGSAVLDAAGLR